MDEISSMPIDMQAKLLRALEDGSFHRVGGEKIIKVDVQILAASNRDLKALMTDNKFRDDLLQEPLNIQAQVKANKGRVAIPEGPGLGVQPDRDFIAHTSVAA